jgi:hypothetical protein
MGLFTSAVTFPEVVDSRGFFASGIPSGEIFFCDCEDKASSLDSPVKNRSTTFGFYG